MSARTDQVSASWAVRPVRPSDLDALLALCVLHARYEDAAFTPDGKAGALARALFTPPARLLAWVAESSGALVGYATATAEFSTWSAREFLHMDCLFVCDGWRGAGLGATLLRAVADHARRAGFAEIQWQTPDWNLAAARFYRREGATVLPKLRFVLGTVD